MGGIPTESHRRDFVGVTSLSLLGLAPRKRPAEAALESALHLTGFRMPLQLCLAEHELAVESHFKPTGGAAPQLDRAQDGRPAGEQLVGQAHGLV